MPFLSSRPVRALKSWVDWLLSAEGAASLRPLVPGLLGIGFLPWLLALARREVSDPLFGDTRVFQYTGWCIRHGLRLYRDVGMADGPFIHYLPAFIQLF